MNDTVHSPSGDEQPTQDKDTLGTKQDPLFPAAANVATLDSAPAEPKMNKEHKYRLQRNDALVMNTVYEKILQAHNINISKIIPDIATEGLKIVDGKVEGDVQYERQLGDFSTNQIKKLFQSEVQSESINKPNSSETSATDGINSLEDLKNVDPRWLAENWDVYTKLTKGV